MQTTENSKIITIMQTTENSKIITIIQNYRKL